MFMLEYWNKTIFSQKATLQICQKKFLWLIKVKNTVPWTYVIEDLHGEKIFGTFYEKELLKTNEKVFRIEKVMKKRGYKLNVKWKGYDNLLKGALQGLRQFLASENPFKKTKILFISP